MEKMEEDRVVGIIYMREGERYILRGKSRVDEHLK